MAMLSAAYDWPDKNVFVLFSTRMVHTREVGHSPVCNAARNSKMTKTFNLLFAVNA